MNKFQEVMFWLVPTVLAIAFIVLLILITIQEQNKTIICEPIEDIVSVTQDICLFVVDGEKRSFRGQDCYKQIRDEVCWS